MTKYYFADEMKKDIDSTFTGVKAIFAKAVNVTISSAIDTIDYDNKEISSFQSSVSFWNEVSENAKRKLEKINNMSEEEIKAQAHQEFVKEKKSLIAAIRYNKKYDASFGKLLQLADSIEETSTDAVSLKNKLKETFNHAYKDTVRITTADAKEQLRNLRELSPAEWKEREINKVQADINEAPKNIKGNQKIVDELVAKRSNLDNLKELQKRFG